MTNEQILKRISLCNVSYHVPGQSDRSAMPIGDGELAASVWVTEDGMLHCYLSRSDALSELDRTIKLCEIRISFEPRQFTPEHYCQTLVIADGRIHLTGKDMEMDLWVERETHSLCVEGTSAVPVQVCAEVYTWRTKPYLPFHGPANPDTIVESADIIDRDAHGIWFFHKNGETILPFTAELEGAGDVLPLIPDLLGNRIFGGLLTIQQTETSFFVRVLTHSCQISEKTFRSILLEKEKRAMLPEISRVVSGKQWNEYWCRSYIFVDGDPDCPNLYDPKLDSYAAEPMEYTCACTSAVTRAYTFTKYMTACCNTGAMPVLYNGMLFNLCPGLDTHFNTNDFGRIYTAQPSPDSVNVNPDERSWCREHLWQNVRHPYYSVLARGETESLQTLFRYYNRFHALNRFLAKRYYGAEGQYNTEMTMSCGLKTAEIYGIDRTGVPDGYTDNRWGGAVDISPGLELVALMLDTYAFTKDADFLQNEVLPYFKDLLLYIETRFPKKKDGKMQIGPINAVETYRDTINPVPITAGLRRNLERILKIGSPLVRELPYYQAYYAKLPDLPQNGETLLPAESYEETRYNVEVPEFYAVYPFRNYTMYRKNAALAQQTFRVRTEQYQIDRRFCIGKTPQTPSCSGWQYTGAVSALLGLTDECAEILTGNCALQNPGTRFPAMWGPVYDAVPDTDHGSNLLSQLQLMLLQTDDEQIYLMPAFPKEWNVSFKLYADRDTCIECCYENGKIQSLSLV